MKKNEIIKDRLEEWVESKGFLNSRFTIIELAEFNLQMQQNSD